MSYIRRIAVLMLACGVFSLGAAGCKSSEKTVPVEHHSAEQPKAEHPKGEHPKGEHPKGEHPTGEHPK